MGYPHDPGLRSYGPVQVKGMGHHHLIRENPDSRRAASTFLMPQGAIAADPSSSAGTGGQKKLLEDPVGQGCSGHDGSKAEHHPTVIAAHHGGIAGEDYFLAWKLGHLSTSDSLLADNVIGQY